MKRILMGLAGALALAACASTGGDEMAAAPSPTAHIEAAVADDARPQADRDRDAVRKPAEMLAFAEVRPGERVADVLPGGGYFTRLFSIAVGPEGHVYAVIPPQQAANAEQPPAVAAIAADPHYGNVSVAVSTFTEFNLSEPVDLVWTSQNYHDLHLARLNLDVGAINRAVFNALKPGGIYLVLDHAAANGSGLRDVDTLHRIDEATVRSEVEAAGFVFDGSSDVLRNPDDARTANVFEPGIRGHTDQFILRFRKPG